MAKAYYATQISPHRMKTDNEGFLICSEVPVARTGYQFYYVEELEWDEIPKDIPSVNGGYEIFRPPEEVFSENTMTSLEGKPVTNDHPSETVNSENFRKFVKGTVRNVQKGTGNLKDFILADLIIYDQGLIDAIEDGKTGVSVGYTCEVKPEDGQLVQRNIICNHVAVVYEGRAGAKAKIRDKDPNNDKSEVHIMPLNDENVVEKQEEQVEEQKEETVEKPVDEKEETCKDEGEDIGAILKEIMSRLEALENKGKEVEKTELEKLDEELAEKEKAKDEVEQVTEQEVPAEELSKDETPAEEEQPKEEMGDCSPLRKVVQTIKPLVAKVKDEKLRRQMDKVITDSIRENFNIKDEAKPKTVYSGFAKPKQLSYTDDFTNHCSDIFEEYRKKVRK